MKAPDASARPSPVPERLRQGGSIIHEHNIVYKISGLKKRFSADACGIGKMHFFASVESNALATSEGAACLLRHP
ncbi:hypothetical protein ACQZ6F_31065 [Rhizobium sp. A22-96]